MQIFVSTAVTTARFLVKILRNTGNSYLKAVNNMFCHDDIFDHENFR